MAFRRRKKRLVSRTTPGKSRWNMKRKRSFNLRFRQLLAGKVLLCLAVITLVVGFVYGIFFTPLFVVTTVLVETEYKDINVGVVQQAVEAEVVQKNSLLLNLIQVEKNVYDAFPDVSSMACRRQIFKQAVHCQAIGYELVAVMKHQNTKYYINENGVVIAFDNRKLGLPIFDLILNPVFAELADPDPIPEPVVPAEPVLEPSPSAVPTSLTASILESRSSGIVAAEPAEAVEEEAAAAPLVEEEVPSEPRLNFIQPYEEPPIEPVIKHHERNVFTIAVGKKILDPEELSAILVAIKQLEKVLQRKVIQAQYVQVAGELSLTSLPQLKAPEEELEEAPAEEEELLAINEASDHEFTVLLDLRRNIEEQFIKLKKTKEVIDFSLVEQIDLSIDGEKVFYR